MRNQSGLREPVTEVGLLGVIKSIPEAELSRLQKDYF